jgi:hypothetical protein
MLVEFGTWYGQNLVLLENLRAILEPFNKQRRIVGFDTFTGYPGKPGWYSTGRKYVPISRSSSRRINDATCTGIRTSTTSSSRATSSRPRRLLRRAPEAVVAFAYFDIGRLRADARGDEGNPPAPRARVHVCCSTS